MHTKETQKTCDLYLWSMTFKFNRVLEIVEIHVHANFQQAKCSGSWVINSALDFGQLDFNREYLWNGSSNRQAENGVINYDFSHVRRKQFGEIWSTLEKMTLTNRVSSGCQGTCSCKISSSYKCSGLRVILSTEKKVRRKQYSPSLPRAQ